MAEKEMTHMEERMYSNCMALAKQSADRTCAEMRAKGRCLNTESFAIVNQWVCLWNAYCRGKATEEDVKACFLLGYVTEEFHGFSWDKGATYRSGEIPFNRLPKCGPTVFWK